jgi:hypothetical protein
MATNSSSTGVIQPGIFEDLQKKIDDDSAIKDVSYSTSRFSPANK